LKDIIEKNNLKIPKSTELIFKTRDLDHETRLPYKRQKKKNTKQNCQPSKIKNKINSIQMNENKSCKKIKWNKTIRDVIEK